MASEACLIVGDLDITRLSDEELFQRLTEFGVVVGPIVCTTRKTYERKLAVLMGASVPDYSFTDQNTSYIEPEEDPDVEPSQAFIQLASSESSAPRRRKPQLENRPIVNEVEDEEEEAYYGEESLLDPSSPLYTPSPRRPLHSPDNSYSSRLQESYLSSPSKPSTPIAASVTRQPLYSKKSESEEQAAGGGMGQLLFKMLLVLLILAVTYLFFVARSEKDAFASLEHLAQTAADAIDKSSDGAAGKTPPPPTGI